MPPMGPGGVQSVVAARLVGVVAHDPAEIDLDFAVGGREIGEQLRCWDRGGIVSECGQRRQAGGGQCDGPKRMASGHVNLIARHRCITGRNRRPPGLFDPCTCEWQLTQVLWFASAELNRVLPGPRNGIEPCPPKAPPLLLASDAVAGRAEEIHLLDQQPWFVGAVRRVTIQAVVAHRLMFPQQRPALVGVAVVASLD